MFFWLVSVSTDRTPSEKHVQCWGKSSGTQTPYAYRHRVKISTDTTLPEGKDQVGSSTDTTLPEGKDQVGSSTDTTLPEGKDQVGSSTDTTLPEGKD